VPYFHVVFTVPAEIEVIAFQNQTVVYDILFRAASETPAFLAHRIFNLPIIVRRYM
jgi:hypothetical protein